MEKSSKEGVRTLYNQLLKLSDREKQALIADNLEELEACLRRKEEIIEKLREAEREKEQDGPSGYGEETNRLLEQVIEAHEHVKDDISTMLIECRKAILELRTGQRAHQAYYRAGRKGRERSARLL
jgi:hypothetical protein